jgi:hypothetical protein
MAKKDAPAAAGTGSASGTDTTAASDNSTSGASSETGASTPGPVELSNLAGVSQAGMQSADNAVGDQQAGQADLQQVPRGILDVTVSTRQDAELPSTRSVPAIEVIARSDGFRRAGLVWHKKPTTVAMSELNAEQVALLQDDSSLRIRGVYIDVDAEGQS